MLHAAVQEERQRAKDRNENEVESTSCANEDMPVEKILEAEQAVEPKTETYIETNLGVPSNSVSWYFYTFFGKHSHTVSFSNKSLLCVNVHAHGHTHASTHTHTRMHAHTMDGLFRFTRGAGGKHVFSHNSHALFGFLPQPDCKLSLKMEDSFNKASLSHHG